MNRSVLEPRNRPRQKRSHKRVGFILDTAEHLVMQHGYEAVTTQMISQETRISPGVLYHYFPGKLGIFAAVAKRTFVRLEECMVEVYRQVSSQPFDEFVDHVVERLVKFYADNRAAMLMWHALEHDSQMDPVTKTLKSQAIRRNARMIRAYFPQVRKPLAELKGMIMEEVCFCLLRQTLFVTPRQRRALARELKQILVRLMAEV